MVSHKWLDFGFNGYQVPINARAPRSARKRRSFKKTCGDDKMCAFDLLATVAGNLLLERGSPLTSSDNPIHGDENKCVVVQNTVKNRFADDEEPVKESPSPCDDVLCGSSSVTTNPNHSNEFDAQMLVNDETGNVVECFANTGHSESCDAGISEKEFKPVGDGHTVVLDAKPDVVVNLGSNSTEMLVCGNNVSHGSRDDVNLVSRDDDENFFGHVHSSWTKKSCRPVPRIGDRRIRKILASRHWKGSKNSDVKPWYYTKRNHYFHHQKNYPIKKRKYFDHLSELNPDGCSNGNGYFKGNGYKSRTKMRRGSGSFSSANSQRTTLVSRDSHVRLRIKSFRVPELFIEIPESATVGSLKRTVMEAVTAILGGGLRVGLMLQGKKVRDDSKTLLQTGISQDNTRLDSLGFCLEPSSSKSPNPEASPCDLQLNAPQPLTSYSPIRAVSQHACDGMKECHTAINTGDLLESDHDSATSPTGSNGVKTATDDSRALVPVVAGPLTLVAPSPPCRKPKRAEQQSSAQRRIRRPFSVTEVEALVQAVEKLGTGRWRDVKLRAFDNADHRTYVDLKDKWKTLVHTAKISPQQRRGEPVPQELLDRVLIAHAYWSEQQHVKQTQTQPLQDTLLLL